ncbi:hypothetical protein BS50DRAFT_247191 [Corynespora cassiicola Philippines]|uniref:Uncharacterized protein n=1 Tax=Corynespora cassiicola Philippines TaxID=1448308 RepID=A0A2T2P3I3_CORCC|nr:hypothetical protein BS50DRAFT_247191 [Corynespora cassiicola Philippines]
MPNHDAPLAPASRTPQGSKLRSFAAASPSGCLCACGAGHMSKPCQRGQRKACRTAVGLGRVPLRLRQDAACCLLPAALCFLLPANTRCCRRRRGGHVCMPAMPCVHACVLAGPNQLPDANGSPRPAPSTKPLCTLRKLFRTLAPPSPTPVPLRVCRFSDT